MSSTKIDKLVSAITKKEGKKKSIAIGDVREILCILKNICKDGECFKTLIDYLASK